MVLSVRHGSGGSKKTVAAAEQSAEETSLADRDAWECGCIGGGSGGFETESAQGDGVQMMIKLRSNDIGVLSNLNCSTETCPYYKLSDTGDNVRTLTQSPEAVYRSIRKRRVLLHNALLSRACQERIELIHSSIRCVDCARHSRVQLLDMRLALDEASGRA